MNFQREKEEDKIILIESMNGDAFEINYAVAREFGNLRKMMDVGIEVFDDEPAIFGSVSSDILKILIDWAKLQIYDDKVEATKKNEKKEETLKREIEFFSKFDNDTLFKVLKGAMYLDMQKLVDYVSS